MLTLIQSWIGKQMREPKGLFSKWVARYMEKNHHNINQWTIQLLNIQENDRILEIGTGRGMTLSKVAEKLDRGKVYGIDASRHMVKYAKRKHKRLVEQEKAVITLGKAEKLPFEDRSFNKLFTVQTIYYLPDIEQVMKEVYRVLQVDGEVFLSFQKQELMKEQKRSQSLSTYSEEDISCLFSAYHFRDVSVYHYDTYICIKALK
ncbi:methyltransferase domain-containing protein [Bacillus altitudinis]|nr:MULTISPECIES: methyltransferase domain-containing protein [Bacillus]MCM3045362.1 methyltransferase domain-containing protein [Bacillus altitudinis]MCY7454992.1 methyltransferase domain-containing protein [Bacillus altitudinis]MDI6560414.1 methyltransferase domain-containing protein [Bacillus altitudinis]MEC1804365.1 methyltransferase domain-containing protein [Bacillus altitudinis]MEC3811827.1 methyltransferase domain-containing protein [Bacillus altitudinis]